MAPGLLWFMLLAVLSAGLLLALLLALRPHRDLGTEERWRELREAQQRLEQTLREELRAARQEQGETVARAQAQQHEQATTQSQQQHLRLEAFATRLEQMNERLERSQGALREALGEESRKSRQEQAAAQAQLGTRLATELQALLAASEQRLAEVRNTLETRIKALQEDNAGKLEQMRATVDEKLQSTLETRLGQSFQLVSERLEQVHRGLGQMQELATGVGDLKRVLSNVKSRGTFGEVQLEALLQDLLVAEQYMANVAPLPDSNDRVEFAIRLPGQSGEGQVWLPIDAKFPREDYERLLDAQERADAEATSLAGAALERRVREEAKTIRSKYVAPPHTTDFAILYLPTEGLYAEVIRRPGLFEQVQREYRVTLAGPTTLTALLNSLQMGFRTLAIQRRSSEVWELLGAVKTEFGKFGGILESAIKQVDTVRNTLRKATGKTTTITRRLRDVESLDLGASRALLGVEGDADEATDFPDDDPPSA